MSTTTGTSAPSADPDRTGLIDALATSAAPEWDAALCRHTTAATRLFFSNDLTDISQAKRICDGCPVAQPCLQGAIDRHEPCGVWGGHLFANGRILAHKRPRGRPPKHGPTPDIKQLAAHHSSPVLAVTDVGAHSS